MKWLITTCLVCLLLTAATSQGGITINFDENGDGNMVNVNGLITPLEHGMGICPDGPDWSTLYYILPYSVTEGDVVLFENQFQAMIGPTVISDVLRFVNMGAVGAGAGAIAPIDSRVYVYSDTEEKEASPELADTGLPTDYMDNLITVDEQGTEAGWNGLNDYTPQLIAGAAAELSQPGYMAETTVTYNFTSDVPEPATICLLGLGALTLIRRK